jgi:glucose-6-phosphate isomerase
VVQNVDFSEPESSLNLPSDQTILKEVEFLIKKLKTNQLKFVVVVGIGGSNLGTMAIYDAVYGKMDLLKIKRVPKLLFVDTASPLLLYQIKEIIEMHITHKEEILINVISKSGSTTETVANFEVLYQFCTERFGEIIDRVVVTTDRDSKLWDEAGEKNFARLEIPKLVGGRYSVFSTVGLFPLGLCGVDIKELLSGAKSERDECMQNLDESNAIISATLLYHHYQAGKIIHDTFFFNPELESLGKWYRQLMAESIGKELDVNGKKVSVGITPTVSIGSTDLHSMAQLYFGGPHNKFFTLVYAPSNQAVLLPKKLVLAGLVEGVEGKNIEHIMGAIYQGVKISFQNHQIPFVEIELGEISAHSLGRFMQFKMLEIMYLAQLLQVNAFDQPNVEDYKQETKKLL